MTDKKPETVEDADLDQVNGGLKISLNDVMVTSYDTHGSDAAKERPARKWVDKSSPV